MFVMLTQAWSLYMRLLMWLWHTMFSPIFYSDFWFMADSSLFQTTLLLMRSALPMLCTTTTSIFHYKQMTEEELEKGYALVESIRARIISDFKDPHWFENHTQQYATELDIWLSEYNHWITSMYTVHNTAVQYTLKAKEQYKMYTPLVDHPLYTTHTISLEQLVSVESHLISTKTTMEHFTQQTQSDIILCAKYIVATSADLVNLQHIIDLLSAGKITREEGRRFYADISDRRHDVPSTTFDALQQVIDALVDHKKRVKFRLEDSIDDVVA